MVKNVSMDAGQEFQSLVTKLVTSATSSLGNPRMLLLLPSLETISIPDTGNCRSLTDLYQIRRRQALEQQSSCAAPLT
jgi:hypothetical protein